MEVALVVGHAPRRTAGRRAPWARTPGSSTGRPGRETARRNGRRRRRSVRRAATPGSVPSTIGLRYSRHPRIADQRATQSAAERSSAGCAPSLEIDSIRSSSQSCCELRLSDRVALGVLATGDVDQRQDRQHQRDAEGDDEDRGQRAVVPGGGLLISRRWRRMQPPGGPARGTTRDTNSGARASPVDDAAGSLPSAPGWTSPGRPPGRWPEPTLRCSYLLAPRSSPPSPPHGDGVTRARVSAPSCRSWRPRCGAREPGATPRGAGRAGR